MSSAQISQLAADTPAADDIRLRAVPSLRMLLVTSLIGLPVLALILPFAGFVRESLALWGLVAVLGVFYALLLRGHVTPVFGGLVAALVTYGIVGIAVYGSVRSTAVYAFVGALIVGGLFLGRRAMVATVLACVAAIGALIFAESAGYLGPPPLPAIGLMQWINHAVVLVLIAINIGFAHSLTVTALAASRAELAERRAVEQALGRSEELFETFFRGNPTPQTITRVDDGVVIDVNEAYLRLFERRRDELVGRTGAAVWCAPERRTAFIEEVARHGCVADRRLRFRRGDGSEFDAIISSEALEWRGARHLFSTITDVSAEAAAKLELEARVRERTALLEVSNRELEAFSYAVSHDLRAPLRAIDGFVGILEENLRDRLTADDWDMMRRVSANCTRMDSLISDLLDLSRIGRMEVQREQVDLSALGSTICAQLQIDQPDRQVRMHIAPGLAASGDPALVRIVLENLLGNAWKFTGRTADAAIEFAREAGPAGEPVFLVRDNGAGFDMRYAGKLFTAFQRMHRQDEFEGSGIGLVTVQRIVARHGGRVWAEGRIGGGATFRFTLDDTPAGRANPPGQTSRGTPNGVWHGAP